MNDKEAKKIKDEFKYKLDGTHEDDTIALKLLLGLHPDQSFDELEMENDEE